ncbi:S53 family peptidase [Paraburkholderia caballeronis]|uniref:S53 family peptidase n=1 Tax=Paraburkholderia caballeronis TaxID=416943 RepID=UPI00106511A9|nr:S53 family peptidase [Paraburkholderia caballeronis]TDV13991.1 kumamolisin [Paraburkholderia caballeronis]TDV15504.1 kumamolisin [Paraburkholderia caballeronis]TDV24972.1 kumamolisin [Paraburkholderia caballeronis]
MTRHPVTGSNHPAPAGAQCIGACDPAERFDVVLILRRQAGDAFRDLVDRLAAGDRSAQPVSRDEYERRFGASADDVARVAQFAQAHGLSVAHADPAARRVVLSGTVQQYNAAFGIDLQRFEHQVGQIKYRFRQPSGPVHLPDDVHDVVTAVLGLDDRAKARPHFRIGSTIRPPIRPARAVSGAFTPLQLAQLYDFPPGDGGGACIALIELGGGYREADLSAYFGALGVGAPKVEAVSVDQAANAPTGDPNGPDGEVTLDVEIAGALAPAALIAVYFAPNSEAGFVDAVSAALHDRGRKPSVVSISWGAPESAWSQQTIAALNDALQTAVALGVTVCVASGDSGSTDGVGDGAEHVDFPASSPYALGCGGTRLSAGNGQIVRETVWGGGAPEGGATGGGVSATFALPAWQKGLGIVRGSNGSGALVRRGVPDVAANADPATGYLVHVGGEDTVVGGTSAVAPLWAALIARINATRGKPAGFVNALLYRQPSAFNDITSGNNGDFSAAPGWDACTGLGTPVGSKVAAVLGAA